MIPKKLIHQNHLNVLSNCQSTRLNFRGTLNQTRGCSFTVFIRTVGYSATSSWGVCMLSFWRYMLYYASLMSQWYKSSSMQKASIKQEAPLPHSHKLNLRPKIKFSQWNKLNNRPDYFKATCCQLVGEQYCESLDPQSLKATFCQYKLWDTLNCDCCCT